MRFSSLSGTSEGVKRNGRWFVLAFICVALVLMLVPAASLATTPKASLKASASCINAGAQVKLTACVSSCPSGATITLKAKDVHGAITTVAAAPAVCGSATFKVNPVRNVSYAVCVTSSKTSPVWSGWVNVWVKAGLTLCVKPGTYCGTIAITGTVTPAWPGGKVTITVNKIGRWGCTKQVAKLTVSTTPGTGDKSNFATTWKGTGGCYVITASVPTTPDFGHNCVSHQVKI